MGKFDGCKNIHKAKCTMRTMNKKETKKKRKEKEIRKKSQKK